jgi:hypothetical protein
VASLSSKIRRVNKKPLSEDGATLSSVGNAGGNDFLPRRISEEKKKTGQKAQSAPRNSMSLRGTTLIGPLAKWLNTKSQIGGPSTAWLMLAQPATT